MFERCQVRAALKTAKAEQSFSYLHGTVEITACTKFQGPPRAHAAAEAEQGSRERLALAPTEEAFAIHWAQTPSVAKLPLP